MAPRIGALTNAVLIAFGDTSGLLQLAMIRRGALTFREPPPEITGLFARAAGLTYMPGRDARDRMILFRVGESGFTEFPGVLGTGRIGGGFAGDSGGCLHALLRSGPTEFEHWVVRDGSAHNLGPVDAWYSATLRVDAAGEVHVVAAARAGLLWHAGGLSEPVDADVEVTGGPIYVRFAIAGTVPHVLY